MHLHSLAVLLANAKVYNEIYRITALQCIHTMKNYTAMEITAAINNDTDNLKTQLKHEIRVHIMTYRKV